MGFKPLMSVVFVFKERMGVVRNLGLEGTQRQTHTLPITPTSVLQTGELVSRWHTIARSPAVLIAVSYETEAIISEAEKRNNRLHLQLFLILPEILLVFT